MSEPETKKKKKSIFARAMNENLDIRSPVVKELKKLETNPNPPQQQQQQDPSTSQPSQNPTEENSDFGSQIHPLLKGLNEDEVLEKKQKILETLDPKLIEFLKKRGEQNKNEIKKSDAPELMDFVQSEEEQNFSFTEKIKEKIPLNAEQFKNIPNMDRVEEEKLAWIGTLEDSAAAENSEYLSEKSEYNSNKVGKKEEEDSSSGINARFNFSGDLLPYQSEDERTHLQALHHHEVEMERPGYTLDELLILARSTNTQQRSIAYETIGNIFKNAHMGIYDKIMNQSLFNLFQNFNLVWTLRKGLDFKDGGTVNSALKALGSCLFPDHDEIALDMMYNWDVSEPFPSLVCPSQETDDDEEDELKDFEMSYHDLLAFLIQRSNLLDRINFLFTTKELNKEGVEGIFKILIRIARHSPDELIKYDLLLKRIIECNVTPNWSLVGRDERLFRGIPHSNALKIFRILVNSSVVNAHTIYNLKDIIFPSIISYLAFDQQSNSKELYNVGFLTMESFKIWRAFVVHGLALEEYLSFFPNIMEFIHCYLKRDSLSQFDFNHAAHLISVFYQIILLKINDDNNDHWVLLRAAVKMIAEFICKILKILQCGHLKEQHDHNSILSALSQGLNLIKLCSKYETFPILTSELENFLNYKEFQNYLNKLENHSLLLLPQPQKSKSESIEESELEKRYEENFISIDSILYGGDLNPIITKGTPLELLTSVLNFCTKFKIKSKCFEENVKFKNYIRRIFEISSSDFVIETNFFLRYELEFLISLLYYSENNLDIFKLGYKILSFLQISCFKRAKQVLKRIIEVALENKGEEEVEQILNLYFQKEKEGREKKVKFQDDVDEDRKSAFKSWQGRIFSNSYWILHPLAVLKKEISLKKDQTSTANEKNFEKFLNRLASILKFLKSCLQIPELGLIKDSTDFVIFYCRICVAFMLDDHRYYMDDEVSGILKDLFNLLLTFPELKGKNKIFSNFIPPKGLALPFSEFYQELVVEYKELSYGASIFTAFVLLPLRVFEEFQIKRIFWSEPPLPYLRISFDETLLPKDYLTSDVETNQDLLAHFQYIQTIEKNRILNPAALNFLHFHLSMSSQIKKDIKDNLDRLEL